MSNAGYENSTTQNPQAPEGGAPAQGHSAPAPPWNTLAIISFVTGVVGIGLAAVITGHFALKETR